MSTWQRTTWRSYAPSETGSHTVVANVRVLDALWSAELDNRRDILVYLPPSYERSSRRYPVLYMHDGQNLFDEATSYCGEWRVDETMQRLSAEGLEAIVVGIPNAGKQRLAEYSPFRDPRIGPARGASYLRFVGHTVKPLVDRAFRTRPGAPDTAIIGSSMGALISLYAGFRFPTIFGLVGALSPALWVGRGALFPFVERTSGAPRRIYLDGGTAEAGPAFIANLRRMRGVLVAKGYRDPTRLRFVEEPGAIHHESAWARRLPDALRFLLASPDDFVLP